MGVLTSWGIPKSSWVSHYYTEFGIIWGYPHDSGNIHEYKWDDEPQGDDEYRRMAGCKVPPMADVTRKRCFQDIPCDYDV